jgi:prepilin-type processing-associated H-X9-DG protein
MDMRISKCTSDPDAAQSRWDKVLARAPKSHASFSLQESARRAGDDESLAYYRTAELARSYVYLGYAVKVVPEFHGWLGATALLPVTGRVQVAGVGEVPIKDFSKDLPVEPAGWPTRLPFPDREAGMNALDSSYDVTTLPTVHRLREGIERYFIMDINGPNAPANLPSALPVMWDTYGSRSPGGPVDRFNHKIAGANVLFMDGRVEFIRYPEKFPILADRHMTDYFGRQGQG